MRNSAYDEHVRKLAITSSGIEVGAPLFGLEGVVTGTARKPKVVAIPRRSAGKNRKKQK
jgi:hypothetical protein